MLARTGALENLQAEVVELAPAKINLALHVVGQRQDGYHLLESIVTFADFGDTVSIAAASEDRFSVSGRFGESLLPALDDNLVIRARDSLRKRLLARGSEAPSVAIHLEKNLPVASGIGGGSADAAAALRGLLRFWGTRLRQEEVRDLALSLGADVPMCLLGLPAFAQGVGEELCLLPNLPSLPLVLGNPSLPVSTPEVFGRLKTKQNPPIPEIERAEWPDLLPQLRNDLEAPARELVPEISDIFELMAEQGATLTRMSGSGATCFGLFDSPRLAEDAAERLRLLKPEWYFRATKTIPGSAA